jgi:hypothetical protein
MAALQTLREWIGIQQFPPATQSKLLEILGKYKEEVPFLFLASSAFCLFLLVLERFKKEKKLV